jgi:hypothetical protein
MQLPPKRALYGDGTRFGRGLLFFGTGSVNGQDDGECDDGSEHLVLLGGAAAIIT